MRSELFDQMVRIDEDMPDSLTAPHVLEYPYTRSTGEVIGRFFAGLKERRIHGIRARDARVLVPPQEYDPETSEALDEWVEVADTGVVTAWTWVYEPRAKHLMQEPFAFALIRLEGADTALLHMVAAGAPDDMGAGMRVRARWRLEPGGDITDIICFDPEVV